MKDLQIRAVLLTRYQKSELMINRYEQWIDDMMNWWMWIDNGMMLFDFRYDGLSLKKSISSQLLIWKPLTYFTPRIQLSGHLLTIVTLSWFMHIMCTQIWGLWTFPMHTALRHFQRTIIDWYVLHCWYTDNE